MFRQLLRTNVRASALRSPVRMISFSPENQPRIRLGSEAPNFQVDTTQGKIDFHEWIGDSWAILLSHPKDKTPVCLTELGLFSQMKSEFDKRNVKLIGLLTEGVQSHNDWIEDIEEVITNGEKFNFPIIADELREVAFLYDMLTEEDFKNLDSQNVFTVRLVFVIDPSKKVRLMMTYPATTGRNSLEVLRAIDALQTADNKGIATPVDWTEGDKVIIPPTLSDADAKKKFGEFEKVKDYLRYTKV